MGGTLSLQVASNFGNGTQVGLIDRGCPFMSGRCPFARGSPFVGGCPFVASTGIPGWALLVVASLGFVTNLHVYNVLQISTMPLGVLNYIGCELVNLIILHAWDWRL